MKGYVELYPVNRNGKKYGERFMDDVRHYESCMSWNKPGDGLMVFTNGKDWAVYQRFGGLLCLYDRFGLYEMVDCYDGDYADHDADIRQMLVNEALEAGFPEFVPHQAMTWRDIKQYLDKLPDTALDLEAKAWLAPNDKGEWTVKDDMFVRVTGISPYCGGEPICEENELSLNLEGCC